MQSLRQLIATQVFQSTRPQGARPEHHVSLLIHRSVSIHAPTRGATASTYWSVEARLTFQSTRPQGARRQPWAWAIVNGWFQSTRPQGARPIFAPTRDNIWLVSIHAPTRGATIDTCPDTDTLTGFNPRAHKGRDHKPFALLQQP